jgi:hypothetical protein
VRSEARAEAAAPPQVPMSGHGLRRRRDGRKIASCVRTHLHAADAVKHHRPEAAVHIVDGGLEEAGTSADADGRLSEVVEGLGCHGLRGARQVCCNCQAR